jgi:hypothetical protein
LNGGFRSVADFYSGFFEVAVNKINYISKWDNKKHEFVPQTQWENFLAGATGHKATQQEVAFEDNGVVSCSPNFTLSGAKKNDITITLPNAITPATFIWTSQDGVAYDIAVDKIAIVLRGLNAQNASKFQ